MEIAFGAASQAPCPTSDIRPPRNDEQKRGILPLALRRKLLVRRRLKSPWNDNIKNAPRNNEKKETPLSCNSEVNFFKHYRVGDASSILYSH